MGLSRPLNGCNLPGTDTNMREDLLLGVTQEVDMVLASFIRNASGVQEMRDMGLGEKGNNI